LTWSFKSILKNFLGLLLEKPFKLVELYIVGSMVSKTLGIEKFGVYNYIINISFILSFLIDLGLTNLFTKYYSNFNKIYLKEFLLIRLVGGLFFCLFFLILLKVNDVYGLGVLLFALFYFFSPANFLVGFFNSTGSNYKASVIRITSLITKYLLFYIGYLQNYDLDYFISVFAFAFFLNSTIYWLIISRQTKFNPHQTFSHKRALLFIKQGAPLALTTFFTFLYLKLDVIILEYYNGMSEVAIYSTASRFSEIWFFIPVALGTVFLPVFSSKKDSEKWLGIGFKISLLIGIISILILLLFSKYAIVFFFGNDYLASYDILKIHIYYGIQVCFGVIWTKWLIAENKEILIFYCQFSSLLINLIMNLILIPEFGSIGAAVATSVSAIIVQSIFIFTYKPKLILKSLFL